MKSIEKLRTAARNMAKGMNLENHEECNLLLVIADAIEAEIAEKYMLLPTDADGVPIQVGDIVAEQPSRPNNGEKPSEVVCMLFNSDGWCISECDPFGHWANPENLIHINPRTVEDVLRDALNEYDKGELSTREVAIAYAAEIRELLGVGE